MKIETIHNIGEVVWFMHENRALSGKIIGINTHSFAIDENTRTDVTYNIEYRALDVCNGIEHVFPTKQALLASL